MSKKPSKSEKRRIRSAAKKEKQKKDNNRLVAKLAPDLRSLPRTLQLPHPNNPPRLPRDYRYREYAFTWTFDECDREGDWAWGEPRDWTEDEYKKTITPPIKSRQHNTWEQVHSETYNGKHGRRLPLYRENFSLENLDREAQDRWMENELREQYPEPARFRIGTNRRVWGFRYMHCYYIVWYERQHNIYPLND